MNRFAFLAFRKFVEKCHSKSVETGRIPEGPVFFRLWTCPSSTFSQ